MVTDEEFNEKLSKYKRMTNMSSKDLKQWRNTATYQAYAERKGGPPPEEAINRNIMLQTRIENNSISKQQYPELQKAVSYLERAKAEYFQEGAGDNKILQGMTTYRVAALRSWAYDPYNTYT